MVHTTMNKSDLSTFPHGDLSLAAINHIVPGGAPGAVSVTLCGPAPAVADWLSKDEGAVELRPEHPWHHASYAEVHEVVSGALSSLPSRVVDAPACTFVSCATASVVKGLDAAHWLRWLSQPMDFAGALESAVQALGSPDKICTIEMGAHPVLAAAAASISAISGSEVSHASTMRRGVPSTVFIKVRASSSSALALSRTATPL